MNVAGEVVVITGGASGIGRGTALALARRGADIVLADVNDRRLAAVEAEIAGMGRRVVAVHCDVSRDEDVRQLAERAESNLGPVGLLMNNAGVVLRGALEHVDLADWQWCFGINVFGVIRGINAFLPRMLERRHGYIVNTGSVAGMVALTGEGALYCQPFGVSVSLLCPGGVRTNLAETGRSIGMSPERQVAETRMAQSVQGGPELEAEYVGELVAQAVRNETFLILPDDVHAELLRRRGRDLNAFVKSRLAAQ